MILMAARLIWGEGRGEDRGDGGEHHITTHPIHTSHNNPPAPHTQSAIKRTHHKIKMLLYCIHYAFRLIKRFVVHIDN